MTMPLLCRAVPLNAAHPRESAEFLPLRKCFAESRDSLFSRLVLGPFLYQSAALAFDGAFHFGRFGQFRQLLVVQRSLDEVGVAEQ
jgi:hypothetical protein